MSIKTIPLSRLEANLRATLRECADSGQAIVVELPDQRLVAIQALEAGEGRLAYRQPAAGQSCLSGAVDEVKVKPAQAVRS